MDILNKGYIFSKYVDFNLRQFELFFPIHNKIIQM